MLSKLHIQNYAIIDALDIGFSGKMNIITGETGAGKSILMGALGLVLGERADSSVLQDKESKCIVEAVFDTKDNKLVSTYFNKHDLDGETEVIIRREIAANGKSRSFINDTPVTLTQLRELSLLLVDLHQQFDTADVGTENFQRNVLDALAGNAKLLAELTVHYNQLVIINKELNQSRELQATANRELDYNRFLFDELNELSLKENELEDLDAELAVLSNAENIKLQLASFNYELTENEKPLVQQIKSLQQRLQPIAQYHNGIEKLIERLNSVVIELKDISDESAQIENTISYDPERIAIVNEKIAIGYKLLKKHSVNTTSELIEIREALEVKLDAVVNLSSKIEKLEKDAEALSKKCNDISLKISAARKEQIEPLEIKVKALLKQVGMPNARLKVKISPSELSYNGTDTIEFLFNANQPDSTKETGTYEPLRKVASGGELSRLMLSIKSLVAKKLQLPTLIFDEIDTGISGEACRQVGNIMKELSSTHQLISITHQPQIAARADAHYFVYKDIVKDKIVTSVRILDNDERITAIARMLSGERPTAAAIENAREMISN